MSTFLTLNRDNIIAGAISSAIVAVLASLVTYLSKLPPVLVPLWLVLGTIGFPIGWMVLVSRKKKLKPIVGAKFGIEKVVCDGRHFIDCSFDGTEIVFLGTNAFSMQGCNGHIARISFDSNAALVLAQLTALRSDSFFKMHIDAALQPGKASSVQP
jgi:hypothetical protein